MKRNLLLKTLLLLCALVVGSGNLWAGDVTCTLTGTNMLEGNSPSTSYANHLTTGITDNQGFKYYGRWTYQTSGGNYYNMIQIKKVESSNSTRIQLPTFDGPIKSITITGTDANATSSSGTGAKTNLLIVNGTTYTSSYATNAANQVLTAGSASTATKTFSFDFTSLEDDYDGSGLYICSKDAAIRIWSIVVVYEEADYYNVTYKYNDGVTADKVVQVAKASAASYSLDSDPSRTDFSFEGWSDGINTYDGGAAYAITKGVTFTAQWAFTGTPTVYNKSNKNDIATGAQYIVTGVNSNVWAYASGISGSNTYIDAKSFESYSTVDASSASITCETPLVLTLEETADGWYLKDAEGKKLGLNGDKKVKWDDGDMTWTLGGTSDVPTFTARSGSDDYSIQYNAGSLRFTGYKSGQAAAYFYRLDDGKDVYTLTLDFNYGSVEDGTHRVLEGAAYTLTTPTRSGYAFTGWNTEENGTGTNYLAGAYTMPAAATTLYAQWSSTVPATITTAKYATFSSAYATDFSTTGITVYTATDNETSVTLNEVEGGQVPANTPVVLYKAGADGTAINVPVIASADPVGDNDLVVKDDGDDVENMYVLANGSKGVGFYPWAGSKLNAGKVYLQGKSSYGNARDFLAFGGTATGITNVDVNANIDYDAPTYNLAGQRVNKSYKGVVIVNGKKMLNK